MELFSSGFGCEISVNNFCYKWKLKKWGKRRNAGESEQDKTEIISFQLLKPKPGSVLNSFLSLIPPSNPSTNLTDSTFKINPEFSAALQLLP